MSRAGEIEVVEPPMDAISKVLFSPVDPTLLVVSSWNKTVGIYQAHHQSNLNVKKTMYLHKAAVLDVDFSTNGDCLYSGGLDLKLTKIDLKSDVQSEIGSHELPISCIRTTSDMTITGSWDKSIKLWDDRNSDPLMTTLEQTEKVFSLDVCKEKMVVALANRIILVYDLRNTSAPLETKESNLKYMTRKIACIPNGKGYATSSIEGRVAVDFFDTADQSKKFSFKCHRQKVDECEFIYPVNALTYHPQHQETFASGGGDGVVSIWDGLNKKRLRQYPAYPTSISSLSFNCDGTQLAVASSYTFEEGEKDHPQDAIFLRSIAANEAAPKSKTR
ncbi:WD40-repeat-containing domain protein [Globomyces pollinis-pini]|nr:WD40-repeat-containing domain protein [Globomyces pollinis-pini]